MSQDLMEIVNAYSNWVVANKDWLAMAASTFPFFGYGFYKGRSGPRKPAEPSLLDTDARAYEIAWKYARPGLLGVLGNLVLHGGKSQLGANAATMGSFLLGEFAGSFFKPSVELNKHDLTVEEEASVDALVVRLKDELVQPDADISSVSKAFEARLKALEQVAGKTQKFALYKAAINREFEGYVNGFASIRLGLKGDGISAAGHYKVEESNLAAAKVYVRHDGHLIEYRTTRKAGKEGSGYSVHHKDQHNNILFGSQEIRTWTRDAMEAVAPSEPELGRKLPYLIVASGTGTKQEKLKAVESVFRRVYNESQRMHPT